MDRQKFCEFLFWTGIFKILAKTLIHDLHFPRFPISFKTLNPLKLVFLFVVLFFAKIASLFQ